MNSTIVHLKLRPRWKAWDYLLLEEVEEMKLHNKAELNNNLDRHLKLRSSSLFLMPVQHLLIKTNAFKNHLTISVESVKKMENSAKVGRVVCSMQTLILKDLTKRLISSMTEELIK